MTNREISTATRERLFVGRFLIECPGRLGFFDQRGCDVSLALQDFESKGNGNYDCMLLYDQVILVVVSNPQGVDCHFGEWYLAPLISNAGPETASAGP